MTMAMQQSNQQHTTGASNLEFNLVSEMHALLKGNAALEQYIQDASQAGDQEAQSCFQALHDQNKQNLGKLRELLSKHLAKGS